MRLLPFLLLPALFTSTLAVADPAPDTQARIQWIQSKLNAASGSARLWQYGWTSFHAASTLVYGEQAYTADSPAEGHDRTDAQVAAISSFLGLMGNLLDPLTTASNARALTALPANNDAEMAAKLKKAEIFLHQNALQEQRARSMKAHIATTLVALISGLVVAHDDNRNDDGERTFAGSLLFGELQIFTAPTDATQAWEAYQRGELTDAADTSGEGGLVISAMPMGIALNYRF